MKNERTRKRMNMAGSAVLLSATLLLSGCAVSLHPLSGEERAAFLEADRKLRSEHVIPVAGEITLYDAMARTVLSNIDYKVQQMEEAVADGEFDRAKMQMLPHLRASGSYTARDPQSASKSMNLETGEVSTGGYTTSEEEERYVGDVTFSWNLLDFGLSYFQARQQADAVLVRREMRRKVLQDLLAKVRSAYWKAWFAQQFNSEVEQILEEARGALARSRQAEKQRLQPLLQSLQYQRALYELITQLEGVKTELNMAQIDLHTLLNIPMATEVTLIAPGSPDGAMTETQLPSLRKMIEVGLDQRPEIRQAMYRSRATLYEVRRAFLKILPGIEFKGTFNFDTNTFLRDNEWWSVWGTLTSDIVDLLTTPKRISIARSNVSLAEYRRLGVHLAVMSQIQIAVRQYEDAVKKGNRALEISRIDQRVSELVSQSVQSASGNPLEAIRQRASALFSKLNHYRSFAEARGSWWRLVNSLGVDTVPQGLEKEMEYSTLVAKLRQSQALTPAGLEEIFERLERQKYPATRKVQ